MDVFEQHAERTGMLLRLRTRVTHAGHSHHIIQESHDFTPSIFCVEESSKNKIHSHRWQQGLGLHISPAPAAAQFRGYFCFAITNPAIFLYVAAGMIFLFTRSVFFA